MFYGAKEEMLRVGDGVMRHISFGKGKRSLVMIQGLNTNRIKGMSKPLAYAYRLFAKDFRVHFFDRPEVLKTPVTVRDLSADFAAAMDALNVSDAAVLGVSQGGMIAEYLAIDRPDLVRRMVLAVTLSRNNPIVAGTIEKWTEFTNSKNYKALVRDMAERMYSEKYLRHYRPLMPLLTLLQKPRDVPRFLSLMDSCLSCTAYDELEKIKCPTLVIGGMRDKVVGAEASLEIAEKLGCEIFMYENLGHAAYEEAKDFNRRVYDFLRAEE